MPIPYLQVFHNATFRDCKPFRIWQLNLHLTRTKYDRHIAAFIDLHWLPISECIEFKVLTLVHQCLDQKPPLYLIEMLTRKDKRRSGLILNAQVRLLEVPRTSKKTFASHAFSVFGPTKWNALPNDIRSIQNNELFHKKLKTHLFQRTFKI